MLGSEITSPSFCNLNLHKYSFRKVILYSSSSSSVHFSSSLPKPLLLFLFGIHEVEFQLLVNYYYLWFRFWNFVTDEQFLVLALLDCL